MPLDIARSFSFYNFLIFFFDFLGSFLIIFFDFISLFLEFFLSLFRTFTYGLHTGGEGLDTLGIFVHAPSLPLLPFSLPITVGSVLACRAATLVLYRVFPEFSGVCFKHCG